MLTIRVAHRLGTTPEKAAEVQRELTAACNRKRYKAIHEMTKNLEEFLEKTDYNGHNPRTEALLINGAMEEAEYIELHQPQPSVRIVLLNSESQGRTYGVIDGKIVFTAMTLTDILIDYEGETLRHMAATFVLGKYLDDLALQNKST